MNLAALLSLLVGMIQDAEGVPDAIRGLAALIAKAQTEKRAITPAEIQALELTDDQERAALQALIDQATPPS